MHSLKIIHIQNKPLPPGPTLPPPPSPGSPPPPDMAYTEMEPLRRGQPPTWMGKGGTMTPNVDGEGGTATPKRRGPRRGRGDVLLLPPRRRPSRLAEPGVSPPLREVLRDGGGVPARQVIPKKLRGERATQQQPRRRPGRVRKRNSQRARRRRGKEEGDQATSIPPILTKELCTPRGKQQHPQHPAKPQGGTQPGSTEKASPVRGTGYPEVKEQPRSWVPQHLHHLGTGRCRQQGSSFPLCSGLGCGTKKALGGG